MADFLVLVGAIDGLLERALLRARELGLGEASAVEHFGHMAAVAWPRRLADGTRIANEGDAWLCAAGTWFHRDGLGVGDEAALLRRFLTDDPRRVARGIDGFFTIAWSDGKRVEVVTDLVASHQTYVRRLDGATAVAGSGLLLASLAPTGLDPTGKHELLCTGIVYEDRSPFAAVRKLGPASGFEVRPDGIVERYRYWSCGELEPEARDGEQAAESFVTAMHRVAARLRPRSTRAVCDLTAGWDSRLLTTLLHTGGLRFETTVAGPPDSKDVTLSRRLAASAGWQHHVIQPAPVPDFATIRHAFTLSDGEMDVLEYARIAHVHEQLARQFDISLNGSFGEVARGYWWEILEPSPGCRGPIDGRRVAEKRYAAGNAHAAIKALWPDDDFEPIEHFAAVVDRIDAELPGDPPRAFRLDHTYLRMRMRSWQGRIASTTDRLWPCLSPLLDRSALQALLEAAWSSRDRNRLARRVLHREAPALARQPLEYGGPAVPLTPWNAWRFVPAVAPLLGKIARRVRGGRSAGPSPTDRDRLALWQDEQLRDVLDPHRMELASHCDPDALAALIGRMRKPEFEPAPLFGRLLGLEMALRAATGRSS